MSEQLSVAVNTLEMAVDDPNKGLPDEVFYYASRIVPLINVDLLIKDKNGRCLLTWRDDKYSGTGWHIPGGIIRYKETITERIVEVARIELGTKISHDTSPLAVNEIIDHNKRTRAHFISLLYQCYLPDNFRIINKVQPKQPGFIAWHNKVPDDLLCWHEIYRHYLNGNTDE